MRPESLKIVDGLDYASAATDRNGAGVDMANHEWVIGIVKFAAIATGATTNVHWEQSTDNSSFADLEGTAITVADDDDNQIFASLLIKPRERYVRMVIDKDASNATAEVLVYVVGGGKTLPEFASVTDDITVEINVSPPEGTV